MGKQKTWGKYRRWSPSEIKRPGSLEELQRAVAKCRSEGKKIRAAGALHSMNGLCETDQTQIRLDKLSSVLGIDKENLLVKVEGGAHTKDILRNLAKEGLTLPNQGYITHQTIAGAAATATHGSGNTGTLSSFIEEIELVDASGSLRQLSPERDEKLFSAAATSLGCLGIVYSLTLRCVPLGNLELTKASSNLTETLENLPELMRQPYFQFILDPYSDDVTLFNYQRTDKKAQGRLKYRLKWALVKTLATLIFDVLPMPWWLIPPVIKIYSVVAPMASVVDKSYRLLSPDDEGHYIEEEIAVPFERFKEALATTRAIIDKYSAMKKRMVAVILLRFTDADPWGLLSPACGRKTAYISLITIAKKGYRELFDEIETALYQYSGRPHWGKVHSLTKEKAAELYGDNYRRFLEAKNELDPDGQFMNEECGKLFN